MTSSPRLQDWVDGMQEDHGHQVDLTVTRNRRTMISIQFPGRKYTRLRIHEKFSEAPENILDHLSLYILTRQREDWKVVSSFARSLPVNRTASSPRQNRTQGIYFDLHAELNFVTSHYFEVPPEASITWGSLGKPRRKKRRSIRFGSWHEDCKQVRIHPLLDQEWVPREFIRYLIYHELCHAVEKPLPHKAGGHRIHHAEFKRLEQKYPHVNEMEKTGKEIFERLIRERL